MGVSPDDWARVERALRYISQVGNRLTPLPELAALARLRESDQAKTDALREYVDACIAEADAADEAGILGEGDLWPASVQDAKRRVNNAYDDLFALARGKHPPLSPFTHPHWCSTHQCWWSLSTRSGLSCCWRCESEDAA